MIAILQFAILVVASLVAAAAAVIFDWLLLRVTLHLMKPAAVRRSTIRLELARGTIQLVRALAPHR